MAVLLLITLPILLLVYSPGSLQTARDLRSSKAIDTEEAELLETGEAIHIRTQRLSTNKIRLFPITFVGEAETSSRK